MLNFDYTFQNQNNFDILIPMPNGSGRKVPATHFVVGEFFVPFWMQTRQITRMDPGFKPDLRKVVCAVVKHPANALNPRGNFEIVNSVSEEMAAVPAVSPFRETKDTFRDPAETLKEAAKELSTPKPLPSLEALDKLAYDELQRVAEQIGIASEGSNRKELLYRIKKSYPE